LAARERLNQEVRPDELLVGGAPIARRVRGSQALDASVLLAGREGFFGVDRQRFATTVDAVRRELRAGRFLYRTSDSPGQEGAFLACSFWLVDALARIGHLEEAAEVMEVACGAGNELGLLSEEVDPESGDLLGNFPQALSHLALTNAAGTLQAATS
jgi:GH15 family glucan-1,4-alpha-glucosidase